MRVRGVMHNNSIFEDDHARPHTAILNQTWKVENLGNGFFHTSARGWDYRLYAPSKMDDFWFIERLWRELSAWIYCKPIPQNAEQFREKIKEWNDLDQAFIPRMINELPTRLRMISDLEVARILHWWRAALSNHRGTCAVCRPAAELV